MLANGTVHGDSYRWWLTIGRPTRLIRADRARAIDRIIDYFGGRGGTRRRPRDPKPSKLWGARRRERPEIPLPNLLQGHVRPP
jgi:hypothetical protein